MSSDFDYSVKFPTLPFSRPTLSEPTGESHILKRRAAGKSSDAEEEELSDNDFDSCSEKEPVVLLLGWLGCKESYLSKYGNIYYQNGCVVIQYVPAADDIFFNNARVQDHASKLLELLEEMTLLENPLFIHLFSNAGAIMYLNILEQVKANKVLSENLNISGVIWDSAPGKARLTSGKRAYLAQMPNVSGILRSVVGVVFVIVLFFISIYNNILGLFDRKRSPNFYKRLKSNVLTCPQLFLYSKCDELIYFKDIEEMINLFKKKGCAVTTLSWEDSAHVQHFREHPDSYAKQCIHFLQSCVSDD